MLPKHVEDAIYRWTENRDVRYKWEQSYLQADRLGRARITYILNRVSLPTFFDFYYKGELRELILIKVFAEHGNVYLCGLDGNKNGEWRKFRLDRISRLPKIYTIQESWAQEIRRRKLRRDQVDPSFLPREVDINALPFVSEIGESQCS